MRQLPILFSTPMVQAITENRKTMTRRTAGLQKVNEYPNDYYFQSLVLHATGEFTFAPIEPNETPLRERIITAKSRYQKGDQLWVKETFSFAPLTKETKPFYPDLSDYIYKAGSNFISVKWKSSLFMPKVAARLWLEVTGVRCERLQDISEADAINEGIEIGIVHFYKLYGKNIRGLTTSPISSFKSLWESINGVESFNANPWVFIYEFKKIEKQATPWKHYTYYYNYRSGGINNTYIGGSKTTMQDESKIIEQEKESFKLWCLENKVTPIDYNIKFEK